MGLTDFVTDGLAFCPLCGEPLTWYGDEPTCSPCVIKGKREALAAALYKRGYRIKET